MKTPKILCSLAALALAQGSLFAATTDPVGFTTTTAGTNSDLSVALPLNRAPFLQSTVASVSANLITINAGLTSANQLVYASPTQTNSYYIAIRSTVSPSSALKGKWFTVTANTSGVSTSVVTVESDSPTSVEAQGLAAGDIVEIIPFWTPNTLFPNGQGLTVTTDIDSPQDIISTLPQELAGTNLQPSQSILYSNDTGNLPSAGWYASGTFTSVQPVTLIAWADLPLAPDTFIRFRNRGVPQTITITGAVPMSDKTTVLARLANNQKQDNFATNPFPIAISLPETNLFESNAFQATTDIDSPKDLLLVYDGTETGLNANPSKTYLYVNDPANLPIPGWYKSGTFDGPYSISDKLIPAGASLIIRKASGLIVSLPWTINKPY